MPIGSNPPSLAEVIEVLEEAEVSTDNPGFCTECGELLDGIEPDAEEYDCPCCDSEGTVYGAAMLLMSFR